MRGFAAVVAIEGLLIGLGVVTGKTAAWVLVAICSLVLMIEGIRRFHEWREGSEKKTPDSSARRIGYFGRGEASKANLSRATFSKDLDTAIENEGEVDASEADFQ